jgi:hypothetical protein
MKNKLDLILKLKIKIIIDNLIKSNHMKSNQIHIILVKFYYLNLI